VLNNFATKTFFAFEVIIEVTHWRQDEILGSNDPYLTLQTL
jgi:hypothetical protein